MCDTNFFLTQTIAIIGQSDCVIMCGEQRSVNVRNVNQDEITDDQLRGCAMHEDLCLTWNRIRNGLRIIKKELDLLISNKIVYTTNLDHNVWYPGAHHTTCADTTSHCTKSVTPEFNWITNLCYSLTNTPRHESNQISQIADVNFIGRVLSRISAHIWLIFMLNSSP